MELDLPDLSHKRPFHYDVLEGKPFTLTSEEAHVRIQINLLTIFLKSAGQLWALEDYWTQMGVATGNSASIADFDWSPAHIAVNNFGFSLGLSWNCGVLWFGHFLDTITVDCPYFCFGWALKQTLCPCCDHMCLIQALLHHCFV